MHCNKHRKYPKSRKRKVVKKNVLRDLVYSSTILNELQEYKLKLIDSKSQISILDYSEITDIIEHEQTLLSSVSTDIDIIKYEENFYSLFKKIYYLENINLLVTKAANNKETFLWNTKRENFSKLYRNFIAFLDSLMNNDIDSAVANLDEVKNGFLYYSRVKYEKSDCLNFTLSPDLVKEGSNKLIDSKEQLEQLKIKKDE